MNESQDNDRRWYPEQPMIGVAVLIFREGEILMAKRGKEPSKGKWSVPGGKLELGETIVEAAEREVLEECAINIKVGDVIDAYDILIRDDAGLVKYHFVDIYLTANYLRGEAKAQSDVDECRWVKPEDMSELDIPPKLKDLFRRHEIINEKM
ncbi:MAG: NUDIX hydrolase, partial [Dehalococcoidia bacterium]|jgi:mutator protein MutT